jgi:hypothetical protein
MDSLSCRMGCSIVMEKKAKQYILDNIQRAIYNKNRIIKEINSYVHNLPSISQFLDNNGQDIRISIKAQNVGAHSNVQPDVFRTKMMRLVDVWKKEWLTCYTIIRHHSFFY